MRAWVVHQPRKITGPPVEATELPDPEPAPGEVRVAVRACGVRRTDLHGAEGDLPAQRSPLVPGHEVVGAVDRRGTGADSFELGERLGVACLRSTCRRCEPAVADGRTSATNRDSPDGPAMGATPSLSSSRRPTPTGSTFMEGDLRSVTANTRADSEAFLRLADRLGVISTTVGYPFEAADQALADLAAGRFAGAAVLLASDGAPP